MKTFISNLFFVFSGNALFGNSECRKAWLKDFNFVKYLFKSK